jgi:hypothetical protein
VVSGWSRGGELETWEEYLVVSCAEHRAVAGNTDAGNGDSVFGDELMGTARLAQVPDPDIPIPVTAYELALVGVDDHVVHGRAVDVIPLDASAPRIPYFDRVILGAGDHPFPLTVERYTCDVAGVAFEGENRVGVAGLDVVKLDIVVAGCGEVAFVGGDAEAVYLGIGMLDCAGADS